MPQSDVIVYDVTVSLALLNVFSQKLADRMQVLATVGKTCAIAVIIFIGVRNVVEGISFVHSLFSFLQFVSLFSFRFCFVFFSFLINGVFYLLLGFLGFCFWSLLLLGGGGG